MNRCCQFFLVLLCLWSAGGQAQGTLHFIVFADTDDPSIGNSNLKTFTYLTGGGGFGPSLARYTGLKFHPLSYYGAQCRATELEKCLSELRAGPDDVLFFYFIGHGFNNRLNEFPSLILGNANTDRADLETNSRGLIDLYDRLRAKQPRLTIVIGEACNQVRSANPPLTSTRAVEVMAPAPSDPGRFKQLFLNWKGGLVMSSCSRNQFSHSDPKGGWMSVAWQNVVNDRLSERRHDALNWNVFLDEVKRGTELAAARNEKEQTPQYKLDVQPNLVSTRPGMGLNKPLETTQAHEGPCAPAESYVNETALAGIREDLPLLREMYERIDSDNAINYSQAYAQFYVNQKPFYDGLNEAIFYKANNLTAQCRAEFQTQTSWVKENTEEINQRYRLIQKYAKLPNQLVAQARSELPSLIRRLEEILEELDK